MRLAVPRRQIGRRARRAIAAAALAVTSGMALVAGQSTAAAASQLVSIQNYAFSPSPKSIAHGDSVVWTNRATSTPHTVTSCKKDPDPTGCPSGPGTGADAGFLTSGYLAANQTFQTTFNAAGSYFYYCKLHSGQMHGEIDVSAPPPPPPPTPTTQPAPPVAHSAPTAQSAPPGAQPAPTPSQAAPSPSPSPSETAQALASPVATAGTTGGIYGANTTPASSGKGPGLLPFIVGLAVLLALAGGVVYFVRTRNPANPAP